MDNQHRQIKGYRELSEADIALMNKVKDFGPLLEELVATVNNHIYAQRNPRVPDGSMSDTLQSLSAIDMEKSRLDRAQPERWAALARTHFQEGLMALTRAVAQPTFF